MANAFLTALTKTLYIYRSSAGSGKTRTLAKRFILLALARQPEYFRFVLAVTFANKATQEMKSRIIEYLDDFAHGRPNNLAAEIQEELHLDDNELKQKSQDLLAMILHKYSQFSISTIDAFFQRVIRSFTREAGLMGNFRLEVDTDFVLDEVITALMDDLGPDRKELTDWVVQFARERLNDGDNWNVEWSLKIFAKEIFKEQFKAVEDRILQSKNLQEDNRRMLALINDEVDRFMNFMTERGRRAMDLIARHGIRVDDFSHKDQGTVYAYFRDFALGKYRAAEGARIQTGALATTDWFVSKSLNRTRLREIADQHLLPLLQEMIAYDKENGLSYNTADQVQKNFFAFGLIADITQKLKTYREENNVMMLADASKFLHGIINESDTPFVYEKVGSWFRHYLIDEFQDTSWYQWKNFAPLLREAGDQGHFNLIVGDVKQSIYRWRSGDLEILQRHVSQDFGSDRVEVVPLDTNYRSAGQIVNFNNQLFLGASEVVSREVNDRLPVEVFSEAAQKVSKWPDGGFVRINFFERAGADGFWEDQSLRSIPAWLERLQDQGARLKNIAILVRTNEEGQRIASYLLNFRHTRDAKPGYSYEVVSNESLRLDTSLSVNVIISALQFLKNPEDKIARAQLAYELSTGDPEDLFTKAGKGETAGLLPEEFLSRTKHFKKLSLFELTEELIRIFRLGDRPEELAYLQAFQDQILEFSARERTDIVSFLEWWELYKAKKSIKVSASIDAASIVTIHSSKGLQYKYVIVPFCNWGLNHDGGPLMWIVPREEPFSQLGAVAVKYTSELKGTQFAEEYRQEYTKAYLDNLNLLYVAFTRAEWGLIVSAPETRSGRITHVGQLVHQVLTEKYGLSFDGKKFELGQISAMPEGARDVDWTERQLDRYHSADWREKLVIKREGAEFFDDQVSDRRSKINRGILIHTVLSRIEYRHDADDRIEEFFLEHALPSDEMEAVRRDVNAVLDHPRMATWFGKEWKVKTEALVLLPGGHQKRIDRIMLGKTRTVIVDYKTGKRKPSDKEQVEVYASVLATMGYPNVQAYLVYLADLSVEEVMSKSNLSLF